MFERDRLPLAIRTRLARLGVTANHVEVARRLVAWDVQIAQIKKRHSSRSYDEQTNSWNSSNLTSTDSRQLSLMLSPRSAWMRTEWPSNSKKTQR